jgi:D-alanyl-D-alanine carboxypeptidase (penicillin-binding protein 5/6)
MGLKAGTLVPMEELIRGIAVVSGNDACVAVAEHISGTVKQFVRKMNVKARQLGMTRSHFMTPHGLPAEGQLTTARDIAKLSAAYLRRFPESLAIHSMQSYTYGERSHHNANRLLGKCPGVDGLKTGFVCASGYNISATAKRDQIRIIAVVMGARNPWIRCSEAEKLIETGFRETAPTYHDLKNVAHKTTARKSALNAWKGKVRNAASKTTVTKKSTAKNGKTSSRHASASKKPPAPVSEKKKSSKSVSHARALKKRPKG